MKKIVYLIVVMLLLTSCGVKKYQTIPYFVDLPNTEASIEDINNQPILKIQKDDILAITVSSLSVEASAIFNLGNTSSVQSGGVEGGTTTSNGFIVDQKGNIQLPYLGAIRVDGLSTNDARELIQKKLNEGNYLKQPVVSLRLVNFKISILGDVVKPGVYPVQSERITVTEALGMAGDLNITALRDNVLLIRESQGKRQQIRLNLQSKDIFNSPYYYLQNNDMLYVQPGEAKYASVDSRYRNATLIISALSVLGIFISRL